MADLIVTTLDDETYNSGSLTDETNDGNGLSLREAIGVASNGDTINFDASLSGGTMQVSSTLVIDGLDVTIDGDIDNNGSPDITLDGADSVRQMFIQGGTSGDKVEVTLDGLTFANGTVFGYGAALGIYSDSAVTVNNSIFRDNSANMGYGGAIGANYSGTSLTINNSAFISNYASQSGGAIHARADLTVTNSYFRGNSAYSGKGTISTDGQASLSVSDSAFYNNSGGAIYSESSGTVNIASSFFSQSSNPVHINSGNLTITESLFSDNSGNAVYSVLPTTIINSSFVNNASGAAIRLESDADGSLIVGSVIAGNDGIGVYAYHPNPLDIINTTITGNSGASIRSYGGAVVDLSNSIVTGGTGSSGISTGAGGTVTDNGYSIFGNSTPDLSTIFQSTSTTNGVLGGTVTDSSVSVGASLPFGSYSNSTGFLKIVELNFTSSGVAVDAGSNSLLPADTTDIDDDSNTTETLPLDINGNSRINGGTVDVGAVESTTTAPTLTISPIVLTAIEDGAAISLAPAASFSDPDGDADLNGATVSLQSSVSLGSDTLAISDTDADSLTITVSGTDILANGTDIGDVSASGGSMSADSGPLTITFDEDATNEAVEEVIQALTFASTDDDPDTTGSRTLTITTTDMRGGQTPVQLTMDVTGVNDAPTVSGAPSDVTVTEDTASNVDLSSTNFADAEGDSLTVTLSVDAGTFSTPADGASVGSGVTETLVDSSTITLAGSAADIGTYLDTASNIQYTGASDANGNDAATLTITPNDGTTDGTAATVNIDITAVNDAPTVSGLDGTPSFTEGGSNVVLDSDVSVSDVELDNANDYSGASLTIARNGGASANDSFDFDTSSASFTVSGANLQSSGNTFATFSVSSGTLTISFTSSGTAATSVLVDEVLQRVTYSNSSDDPSSSVQLNWTFSDGADNDTGSITVSVAGVNDAPVLDDSQSPILATIDEDASSNTGTTVASMVVDSSITDADGSAVESIAVTTVDNTNGVWQYSTDDGINWNTFSSTTGSSVDIVSSARLLSGTHLIRFLPDADYNGSATITFRAWDETSGTAGSTADTSTNSGTSAFSSVTDTASVTVNAVNDAPTVSGAPSDMTAIEDTASDVDLSPVSFADVEGDNLTVTLSVDEGSFGSPANGSGVTETLVNSSTITLVGSATDIATYLDTASNIQYTGVSNASGDDVATLTITPNDGTTNGTAATVNIDITNVNDAPEGTDKTVSIRTTGQYSFSASDFGFSDGDVEDSLNRVQINIQNIDNGSLLLSNTALNDGDFIAVSDIGNLVYTPSGTGTDTFTFTVEDDSSANLLDSSPNTFTLVVTSPPPVTRPSTPDPVQETGDDTNNAITGDTANDSLNGGGGDDSLSGQSGSDRLDGGTGNDTIDGGDDDDTLGGGAGDDFLDGGNGNDRAFGGGEDMGADTIIGGTGNDTVGGGNGNDNINGGDDDDTAFGGAGDDNIQGDGGNDLLFNGEGDDTVYGGDGDDELWAGSGNDDLAGGAGSDTFVFGATSGHDTITDFNTGDDVLNLSFSPANFSSLADVVSASIETIQNGVAGVLIDIGDDNSVFIQNLTKAGLTADIIII